MWMNCSCIVFFTEPPTIPEDAETEFDIIANNRITLPCSAKGTPAPKIKWYKDDEIITGNEAGMKISPDGSLQIENPRGTNAGRYKCVAENVAGSVSHYINLQVYCELMLKNYFLYFVIACLKFSLANCSSRISREYLSKSESYIVQMQI